jgi:hypothetical protein
MPSTTRPRDGARQHQLSVDAGVVGRHAHAAAVKRRAAAATAAKCDLSRTAGAPGSVPRRPAHGLVRQLSSEPTPLFTRHTRGVIEVQRDRRRQRAARGTTAYLATARERATRAPHARIAAAVASNARAVTQAHLDMERWIDDGGLVPFEAAALLRATTRRR